MNVILSFWKQLLKDGSGDGNISSVYHNFLRNPHFVSLVKSFRRGNLSDSFSSIDPNKERESGLLSCLFFHSLTN